MTADQRRAINRHNARKSTGPNTPEGKERARQNALKHGLCAATLALSIENADDLQDQFDEWVASYQPVGPAEFAMVEEIAVAQLRLRRCRRRDTAVVELQLHAAEEVWYKEQEDRLDAAHALFDTDPAAALEDLKGFGGGRRWLIDCWTQFGPALLRDRYACAASWIDEGVRFLDGDPAQPAAGPLSAYEFRLACTGARPDPDPKVLAWLLSDAAIHPDYLAQHGRAVPAGADCRDRIDQLIAAEIAALQEAENDGAEDEQRELDDACLRAQVPCDGPDTKLSLRYEATARAALHKALKALDQLQDARFAAEAETGGMPTSAWACAPTPDMPTQTWACHPETPLPSVARNEPETPQEPQPSAEIVTSCDAYTDTNFDDSSGECAEPSRAATATPERAGASVAARPRPSPPVVPVVTSVTAASPPA